LALALGIAMSCGAYAQTNTGGSVFGQAGAGDVITAESAGIGVSRTATVGGDGNYRFSQLAPGAYRITRKAADGSVSTRDVTVSVGTGSNVSFGGIDDTATNLESITVIGGAINPIDVSSVESTTVMTEQVIDRLPVARSVTSVAMLAPGTTMGDARIGGDKPLASFGGSSVAENVYFINGFNVTNTLNGTTFNEVPFEATAEMQVKTGGYGAEFGRSLGGVVNTITKRGTNEWKFGGNVIFNPRKGRGPNMRSLKDPSSGKWLVVEVPGYSESTTYNAYASGPLVKDRLFVYGLYQGTDNATRGYGASTQVAGSNDAPQGLLKLDWNISDRHGLEFTAFRDRSENSVVTYKSPTPFGTQRGDRVGERISVRGGDTYIGKWTGYLTENLTMSALYGVGKYSREDVPNPVSARDDCPVVQDARTSPVINKGCFVAANWVPAGTGDKRTAWRVDGEWSLGAHTMRFGMDNEEFASVDGTRRSGPEKTGYVIRNLAAGGRLANGYVNETGGTIAYVDARHFENGGTFLTRNAAWYLEDTWQVNDDFVAYLGLRNEQFKNLNTSGEPFIDIRNTWAPRLGFSWDIHGDSTLKVFGTAGRYYIPVYSNTNTRLSGAELDYTDYYLWDGTFAGDAAQRPGLGMQLGGRMVRSDGTTPDPRTVVDPDIKPLFQDEIILGFQAQLSDSWIGGVRAIFRKLKSGMDDYCSFDFPHQWAIDAGYSEADADLIGNTVSRCYLMNPGNDLKANVDFGDGLEEVVIPADALGLPAPRRSYRALDFFFERAWDGKWFLQGSYTYARNVGNTEGYVKSDIGQDDAGITQDFDFPGLMEGSYGDLPNDRRHSLKVFGAYQVTETRRAGANLIVQSGKPVNCFGFYAGTYDPEAIGYGSSSFYCNRELHARGSHGRLPWTRELGLQLSYEPKGFPGFKATLDVLNVFDAREVTSVQESGETGAGSPSPSYLQPLSVQQPRSFRLTLGYDF
jgi:hypothetical protein